MDFTAENRERIKNFAWDGKPAEFLCVDCGATVLTCNPASIIQCKDCKEKDAIKFEQKRQTALNRRKGHNRYDDFMAGN